ncbi:hypothetical protein ALC57_03136, partial [Trachymyrmex cornetzi]
SKKDNTSTKSASAKKIRFLTNAKVPEDMEKYYRIIDFLLVFKTISTLVKCATCGENVSFKSCDKQSLGFKIEVKCAQYKQPKYIPSSSKIGERYEVNFRFIFVMRLLGLGNAGCQYKNCKLRIDTIGDGDSKTFAGVKNAKPYGEDFEIYKKECVGHVQKRMGSRLRNLVKNTVEETATKGKTIRKKTLFGKGKLTAKTIDKLTIYYGLAIRRNSDSVEKMKTAI